jgi:hypothetical protein
MRDAVGKTIRKFLHILTMTPAILQEYSSGPRTRWLLDFGRFSERLPVIANPEQREYLEIPR